MADHLDRRVLAEYVAQRPDDELARLDQENSYGPARSAGPTAGAYPAVFVGNAID
jgi:hypothetical protein